MGDSSIFSIVPLSAGGPDTPFMIPADLLGNFVAVKAHRQVEDQVGSQTAGNDLYSRHCNTGDAC